MSRPPRQPWGPLTESLAQYMGQWLWWSWLMRMMVNRKMVACPLEESLIMPLSSLDNFLMRLGRPFSSPQGTQPENRSYDAGLHLVHGLGLMASWVLFRCIQLLRVSIGVRECNWVKTQFQSSPKLLHIKAIQYLLFSTFKSKAKQTNKCRSS